MLKIKYIILSFILMSSILFSGCSISNLENTVDNKINSIIGRTLGNKDSEIVIVYSQGGPDIKVETGILEEIRDSDIRLKDAYLIQPHQVQTENPKLFKEKEISFEEAVEYDKKSILNISEVIKYYKNKGKKVYVVGISFGAFVTTDLLLKDGSESADGYGIMVGRLDMDDIIWKSFSEGNSGGFKDGIKAITIEGGNIQEKNMNKLAAGLGHKRYTELLDKLDLSRVVYVYGEMDNSVGRLTEKEIAFLKNHNATVISNGGGHSEASTYEISKMMDVLLNVKMVKKN